MQEEATFVIIGGGIAGVSCAEALSFYSADQKTILITASPLIKAVTNVVPLTKTLCQFDVKETVPESLTESHPYVSVIQDTVTNIDSLSKTVSTKSGKHIKYKKLCICSGGHPKVISKGNPFVLGIRDTESVREFQERIKYARKILVIGNGGIATEIVYAISSVEIVWVIKNKHISATFVDPGAAEFFQSRLIKGVEGNKEVPPSTIKRIKYTLSEKFDTNNCEGAALGPDWHTNFDLRGTSSKNGNIVIEYETEIRRVWSEKEKSKTNGDDLWPVYVELTNGKVLGCDFVVSATGVIPNVSNLSVDNTSFQLAEDGGIKVDWKMESSIPDIFAAGDVCTAAWPVATHWFQMRLWTQARQMGAYAAKCMAASLVGEEILQDFCFEMFSHVTKFFGYKVVLLGLYNGQTLEGQYEALLRVTKGMEYIKLVMKDGKMQGAVLIGETDLEEMCENLILNQLDLTSFGEELLNPDIDIEDYFD